MDRGYFTLIGVVVAGVAYGLYRARHPSRKSSNSGRMAFAFVAVLVVGLLVSAHFGNESLTWFFGLSLMVVLPLMLFLAIGTAIGSSLGRSRKERQK
jgi:hypothetical protein